MKILVTLTSKSPMNVGYKVRLRKEPENNFDNEAIQVILHDGQQDGYVSAHYRTRKPGTYSAGRLLDKIPQEIEAVIVDIGPVVAEVDTDTGYHNESQLTQTDVADSSGDAPGMTFGPQ